MRNAKFVSYEKMSKREQKRVNSLSRSNWGMINPQTKIISNKKKIIGTQKPIIEY